MTKGRAPKKKRFDLVCNLALQAVQLLFALPMTATETVAVFIKEVIMTKTQKILSAICVMALGVMLIVLRGDVISIAMTVLGIGCIALGILDLLRALIPPAVIKLVVGTIIIVCGWTLIGAVLYIVAGILLILGILLVYEKIKRRVQCGAWYTTLIEYAIPALCIVLGILLLFNQGNTVGWVFVVSGSITVLEGGVLLVDAIQMEN